MRVEILIHDKVAGYGHVDPDGALVMDEWVDGWCGVQRLPHHSDLAVLAEQGVTFREDKTIPFLRGEMKMSDGSVRVFGPGRLRSTKL